MQIVCFYRFKYPGWDDPRSLNEDLLCMDGLAVILSTSGKTIKVRTQKNKDI